MGHFVRQHCRDFLFAHAFQQAGRHGDQRVVLERAGGERIGRAFIDGDFRAADAGAVSQLVHGVEQPCFALVARRIRIQHLGAGAPLGHRLADQERDDRTRETHHHRKDQQGVEVKTIGRDVAVYAQDAQRGRQHEHDGQVGDDEQDNAFHVFCVPLRAGNTGVRHDGGPPVPRLAGAAPDGEEYSIAFP
ncbi:hypothetical protein D3C78_1223700 [compost metagenome]